MCGEHFETIYVGKMYQQGVQNRVILRVLLSSFWLLLSNIGMFFDQIGHVWATLRSLRTPRGLPGPLEISLIPFRSLKTP